MNENNDHTEMQQICSIRISFPVETDEQAIEYKKKIGEVLAPIKTARVEFTLSDVPKSLAQNAR